MKKILILTDFSKRSEHAAELALRIAEKTNSEVIIYNAFYVPDVIPAYTGVYPYYEDVSLINKENSSKLEKFVQHLTKKSYSDGTIAGKTKIAYFNGPGSVGGNIKSILSSKKDISMIVMGDKNPQDDALDRFLYGSDANEVINNAACPVILVPEKAELKPIRTIALATKLERTDFKALSRLAELANFLDAKIIVTHVCPKKLTVEEKLRNMDIFNKMRTRINYHNIGYEDILGDNVSAALAKFARSEKIDLLAVIRKKRTFLAGMFHSSTTNEMLDYHKVPLMVFP